MDPNRSPLDPREDSKPEADDTGRPILSASQVDTFMDCPRKWGWRYLEDIPDVGRASTIVGKRVHSIVEAWLRDGTVPNAMEVLEVEDPKTGVRQYFPGQIAQAGLHLLPPPGVCKVEGGFKLATKSSKWRGFKDAVYILGADGVAYAPHPVLASAPGALPVVRDHKTTSNFRWMKSPEDLLTDVQAILYAASTMEEMGARTVKAEWGYFLTSNRPSARLSTAILEADHVAREMERIDHMAAEIQTLYREAFPRGKKAHVGLPQVRALDLHPVLLLLLVQVFMVI